MQRTPETPEETRSQHSALKPYDEMLVGELNEGIATYERANSGLFASSVSAGIDVSFSVLVIAVAHSLLQSAPAAVQTFAVAALYPIGFVFVILGRTELFTEQTTLAIVPVLHGRASLLALARLWGIVYVGNLLGLAAAVLLFTHLGPELGIVTGEDFVRVAAEIVNDPPWLMILSGSVTGWLMGLLSWLLVAARETISQIFLVWLVAAVIGIGQLHHSIVGAGEVFAGLLFSPADVTLTDAATFLLSTTLGNAAGALVFALLLKSSEGSRGDRLKKMEQRKARAQQDASDENSGGQHGR